MNVVTFLIVSMWEWFALILLTFAMYRFDINQSIGQLVFASFLLSLFSYMLFNVFELTLFATLIQPIVVFLFFWLMFKIPVFYAGLVVINGYLAYCLITSLLYYFIQLFGIVFTPSTPGSYIIQSFTGFIVLLLTRLILKFRLGFSFAQYGHAIKQMNGINLKLLVLTIVGYIALSSFNMLYYGANKTLIVLISMIVAFGLLQYWAFKKEYEAAFWNRNKKYNIDA